ncbi:hypothetical protein K438DRAFT_1751300 [Mycena galopus ATCC 62051]|nr:hypothetical protein K438DRAFT_1751300 [Mycena galopus ATCC 62051]
MEVRVTHAGDLSTALGGTETVVKIWVGGGVRASWVAVVVLNECDVSGERVWPGSGVFEKILKEILDLARRHTDRRTHDDCGGLFVEESQIVGINFEELGVKGRTRYVGWVEGTEERACPNGAAPVVGLEIEGNDIGSWEVNFPLNRVFPIAESAPPSSLRRFG